MEAVVVRGDCWCWRWCRGAASHSHPASAPPHGNWGAKLRCCGVLSMRPLAPRHAQCHSPFLRHGPCAAPHIHHPMCARVRVGGRVRLSAVGVGPCGLKGEGLVGRRAAAPVFTVLRSISMFWLVAMIFVILPFSTRFLASLL